MYRAVGFSVLDDFVSAADVITPARLGGAAIGLHLRLQHLGRRPGFHDETAHERERRRAGDGEIVDRPIHRRSHDRSAGNRQRSTTSCRWHRKPGAADAEIRRVAFSGSHAPAETFGTMSPS